MARQLSISVGQYSDKGRKKVNQDFHGVSIPKEPALTSKGIAIALADGISSSQVSQIASQATVTGFLADYYCTSETWSVKRSAEQVLTATNSWLFSQTYRSEFRYNKDKGYVCTLSCVILKSTTAHIFHIGDSRVYQLRQGQMTQLTEDHRSWSSPTESHLSRAMGVKEDFDIDYQAQALEVGDVFILTTDGVYEFVSQDFIIDKIQSHDDLDFVAKLIVEEALERGSDDNLTIQIIRVDTLPNMNADELYKQLTELPFPPELDARMEFDGFTIIRTLHFSSRSHVYLANDNETGDLAVIKTPSVDMKDDPAYLERFLMEEWVARRVNSPHVLKPRGLSRQRQFLYVATEYIEGQTLTQWMRDNPKPDVSAVRDIVKQIARGLQAFHRLEMLHQDLRPENIMIDVTGTVKIIDFGSTKVAGLSEISSPLEKQHVLGTAQYTAPEYFLGEPGSPRSDLFSLAVICYQMLSGNLPYGIHVSKARTKSAQNKLTYQSVLHEDREIPAWIDDTLKRALHPNPYKRYEVLSEFIHDLERPNKAFLHRTAPPLMERNPVLFWKGVSLCLSFVIVYLLTH
jgi:serine/threonine protein kinase